MALAPPLEVWNSRKSWKSGGYTRRGACTPPGSVEFLEIVEVSRLHRLGACTPSGSVEFLEIVEVRRLHPTWRLHPLWKCGIPGNRGSQAVTPHTFAPPLEVWNSRKSWKSRNRGSQAVTPHALAPPLEVWNSRKSWKFHTATCLLLKTKRDKVLATYFFTAIFTGFSFLL